MKEILNENIEIKNNGLCYYDNFTMCCNPEYITGAISYCLPPCYTCKNYKLSKEF